MKLKTRKLILIWLLYNHIIPLLSSIVYNLHKYQLEMYNNFFLFQLLQ